MKKLTFYQNHSLDPQDCWKKKLLGNFTRRSGRWKEKWWNCTKKGWPGLPAKQSCAQCPPGAWFTAARELRMASHLLNCHTLGNNLSTRYLWVCLLAIGLKYLFSDSLKKSLLAPDPKEALEDCGAEAVPTLPKTLRTDTYPVALRCQVIECAKNTRSCEYAQQNRALAMTLNLLMPHSHTLGNFQSHEPGCLGPVGWLERVRIY